MLDDYRKARKRALKELQRDVSAGHYPYPPALDDILKGEGSQGEIPLGLAEIDLSLIAGTRTRGRQNTFSRNFMPLPEPNSEFAGKWSALIDSQREEGIREPIVVYEFLQRFYVQEGNKRVSVSRYLDAPSILAKITRVVPMPSDHKAVRIYREFTDFYNVAPIYGIIFGEEGGYLKLAAAVGQDLEHPWPEDAVKTLRSAFFLFASAWRMQGGNELDMEIGDAFLIYLKIYGLDEAANAGQRTVDDMVRRIWTEFIVSSKPDAIAYVETPAKWGNGRIIPEIKHLYQGTMLAKPLCVAFIYECSPLESGWEKLHDAGRHELELRLGPMVKTITYTHCKSDAAFDRAVEDAVAHDADLIVTVHPTQMTQALRAAVSHPSVQVINCSVSLSHSAVRTFYGRMYEPKFLLGALAASMAKNHKVGYVAETPIFSTVSEINAFAIGAQMVDPYVTVFLKWFSAKDYDWRRELAEEDVRIISGHDYPNPQDEHEPWGVYRVEENGAFTHLAAPVWHWGRYYELIAQSIRSDSWSREAEGRRDRALNYWWGMSAGILDTAVSPAVPRGQRTLVEIIRQPLLSHRVEPFAGALVSQSGPVQSADAGRLSSEEIVRMNWLNENVVGRLPEQRELSQDGLKKVEVAGVIPLDPHALARTEASS